jgi:hypothetical protein
MGWHAVTQEPLGRSLIRACSLALGKLLVPYEEGGQSSRTHASLLPVSGLTMRVEVESTSGAGREENRT